MQPNPYKYTGPLDPVEDDLVCVSRSENVKQVVDGIMRGDYWAILGPRQIGKTTFLHLIKTKFVNAHYVHLDFTTFTEEENPYKEVSSALSKHVPSVQKKTKTTRNCKTASRFIDFLENFKPKEEKKIIFLVDEIDKLPSIKTFLDMWRKIFNVRLHQTNLKRYCVITTGAENLVKQTIGKNSPFNIAKALYIKDFSEEESEKLIDEPFKKLDIEIEPGARKYLMSQVSGHPQILQHTCYLLVEKARASNIPITKENVDEAIDILFEDSTNLDTLRADITRNKKLRHLVKKILKGKEKKYYPYSELSTFGAGAIVKRESFCEIRNEIYRIFINDILKEGEENLEHEVSITLKPSPEEISSDPQKKLKKLIVFIVGLVGLIAAIITLPLMLAVGVTVILAPIVSLYIYNYLKNLFKKWKLKK